ncbi:MAG TPA: hypothetical protein VNJ52_03480 [Patescibacteria group bacterium]|nr:hypothetical protein [Patescibacteria group bacterium]
MVAVFVLGGLVGGLGAIVGHHLNETPRRERIIDRLSHELDLSAQQRTEIQAIFADGHKRFDAVFQKSQDQARPQYDAIRHDIHARIRAILMPAQQAKFDDFLRRLDAEHRLHHRHLPDSRRRGR